jgi:NADPH:quinone reductase-like Zn-dependent oxidoreductase
VAGTVEAVGAHVTRFRPGDRVFGELLHYGMGGFAEYVCADQDAWVEKPADLSFEDAAALPMAGTTALQGLRDTAQVRPGEKLLINGASGGVGSFAVQLAKHLGAEVTAVCSTRKIELVRSLGADHVIDYTREDFTKGNVRYDVIFAVNGYRSLLDYKRALSPSGRYVMAGGTSAQIFQTLLFGRLVFLTGGKTMAVAGAKLRHADLAVLADLARSGKVKPIIDRRFSLSEVPDALWYLIEGRAAGKVVIAM